MTSDQVTIFVIIGLALVFFLWDRWRYDIVAVMALLASYFTGLIPANKVFLGLCNPAVITVAAVLLISRGLQNAGVVNFLAKKLLLVGDKIWLQNLALCSIVAFSSAFMNNVGALALFMPVAIWMSRQSGRSPSLLLMPIAFASLIGGTLTLIGTPSNIIVSSYREQAIGSGFAMFDFLPVGIILTIAGIAFISFIGWRLLPYRGEKSSQGDIFQISSYMTELRVSSKSKFTGQTLKHLYSVISNDIDFTIIALIRNGEKKDFPSNYTVLKEQDVLLIRADAENIKKLKEATGFEIEPAQAAKESNNFDTTNLQLMEAIITPGSKLIGRSANKLFLRDRNNINVIAIAREGRKLTARIDNIKFANSDILLIQASEETIQSEFKNLGLLPLASRGLQIGKPQKILLASAIFITAIIFISLNYVSAAIGMVCAGFAMVLAGIIHKDEIYESIDISVIVLLAAMLPIGGAFETTGASNLVAEQLILIGKTISPHLMLAIFMTVIMLISNVLNHTATAVLASPIAISLSKGLNVSVDPFLMAVVIACSCTLITPIGHQSNTLVMGPGGYKFGDYFRLGFPLSIIIIAVSVPAIIYFWPF